MNGDSSIDSVTLNAEIKQKGYVKLDGSLFAVSIPPEYSFDKPEWAVYIPNNLMGFRPVERVRIETRVYLRYYSELFKLEELNSLGRIDNDLHELYKKFEAARNNLNINLGMDRLKLLIEELEDIKKDYDRELQRVQEFDVMTV